MRISSQVLKSTKKALVKVAYMFLITTEEGLVSVLVFLDLNAAFDHHILLKWLEHFIGIKLTAVS